MQIKRDSEEMRRSKKEKWHKWWAWYPVRIDHYTLVWLETIERKQDYVLGMSHLPYWQYRRINND